MAQKRKPHIKTRPALPTSTRRAKRTKQPTQTPEFESVLLIQANGKSKMVKRVWGS